MTAFGEQVVALLDHLGAPQAVIGGTSLGANVSLEVAVARPRPGARAADRDAGARQRARGGDHRVRAADVRGPLPAVHGRRGCALLTRPIPRGLVPFWVGIVLDTLDQRPGRDGRGRARDVLRPDRAARPASAASIAVPALVVGHPTDPIHPAADAAMLAEEMPNAHVRAGAQHPRVAGRRPTGSTALAAEFALELLEDAAPSRRPPARGTPGEAEWTGAPLPRRGDRAAHPQAG